MPCESHRVTPTGSIVRGVREISNVKIQRLGAGALVGGILLLSASVARAQEKNEVGLVIGAAVTPSRNFASGSSATVAFDSSLALGAEYDRRLLAGPRAAVYGGVDFLASPLDVKLSNPPSSSDSTHMCF